MSTFTRDIGTNLPGIFAGLGQRYTRYKTYRSTCAELEGLSQRELRDLGIAKANIRSIAYQAAYGG